ncbi:MAG: Hsp20/alpha crystallin family protein [Bacteroidales bacterium]|nr:Hsp20/alpha crystallin family protein [Bacteroidales bacterium]
MTLARLSNNWFPSTPSLFDRFFDGDLTDLNRTNYSDINTTMPAVNITDNEDEFLIELAAPGLKKNDFKIDYDNGRLTISAEFNKESKQNNDDKFTRREFSYGSFQRSFTVAKELVDTEKIAASYKDGILNVVLPKRDELKPKPVKQIKIA